MPKQDGEISNIPDIGAVTEECAVAGGRYKKGAVIIKHTIYGCCVVNTVNSIGSSSVFRRTGVLRIAIDACGSNGKIHG